MKEATLKTIENVLAMDDSITKEHREKILTAAKYFNPPEKKEEEERHLPTILKEKEVAERLGVCPKTVRNWKKEGKLHPFNPCGKKKVTGYLKSEVERFLNASA